MSLSVAQFKSSRQTEAVKVAGLFPESMQTSAENLVTFIEKYYEYLNSVGLPSYEISNITSEKDIDLTSLNYLDEIQSLIARSIPASKALDKLTLYKIIFKYYHTRGSEDSIHSFFKIFFNQLVEIFYPKDFLFDLSNGSGEWGEFDPFKLRSISTNPNKKYMRVSSEIEIAPIILNKKGYNAKSPLLIHAKDNLWTQDGKDTTDFNVPFINRVYIDGPNHYRWVYQYQSLYAVSDSDDLWPDSAKWSVISRDFVYEELGVIDDRDVNYEETSGVVRDLEFLNTIAVEAVPEPGVAINEYVLSLEDLVNLKIYRLTQLVPAVWTETKVEGKFWNYIDSKSMLSHRYRLQDSYYWQNYSYEIKSATTSEEWLNQYFKFVHPSGLKLFTSLLLEFFNRNDWTDSIDYASRTPEDTYSWLNAYRAPKVGRHAPKFQPGWLTANERLFTFILTALRQQYIGVLGGKFIITANLPIELKTFTVQVSSPEHGFVIGDKITIFGASSEPLNATHTITQTQIGSFSFIVSVTGTTSLPTTLENKSVRILKNIAFPPDGYKTYENLLCQILLKIFLHNENTRESIVHKTYQDWLKFADSTELISGYLDKPIDLAIKPYDERSDVKFNNISSFVGLNKNYKIVDRDTSNQFYPWKYSQIIKFIDDDKFFSTMYDTYIESYTRDVFDENASVDYNFSYTPEFIPPIISFTSPIVSEASIDIAYENDDTILLENAKLSTPKISINTFEYILENGNTRIFEDGDIKSLIK